jgi:hypothetical protein
VSKERFKHKKLQLSENANKVFAEFDKISVDKMPSNSRNYIGAKIVKAGAFVPLLLDLSSDEDEHFYAIDFLSDHIAKVVALACNEENYNKWTRSNAFKFDYLIAESIVTHCLMDQKPGDIVEQEWNFNKWDFFKNDSQKEISSKHHLIKKPPTIPPCKRQIIFNTMYLSADVSELQKNVLYRSSVHNGALYDHLVVVGCIVYVFQSSKLTADSHSLDYSIIEKVMNNLQFDLNHQYSMVYVYCNDSSTKKQTGCSVTNNKQKNHMEITAINERFKIIIARVCYYPHLVKFEI